MAATTITETILSFTIQTKPEHVGTVIAFASTDRSTTPLRMRRAFVAVAVAAGMFAGEKQADAAFAAAQSGNLAAWKAV